MQVTTKMKIARPTNAVFEAFVDPEQLSHYWFSSGTERWEPGKTVTLRYEEYGAQVQIRVTEIQVNQRIVFQWDYAGSDQTVTITLTAVDPGNTVVEVTQTGWQEDDEQLVGKLLDNKEGWVYMLTCLKAYVEFGISTLRAALVK